MRLLSLYTVESPHTRPSHNAVPAARQYLFPVTLRVWSIPDAGTLRAPSSAACHAVPVPVLICSFTQEFVKNSVKKSFCKDSWLINRSVLLFHSDYFCFDAGSTSAWTKTWKDTGFPRFIFPIYPKQPFQKPAEYQYALWSSCSCPIQITFVKLICFDAFIDRDNREPPFYPKSLLNSTCEVHLCQSRPDALHLLFFFGSAGSAGQK